MQRDSDDGPQTAEEELDDVPIPDNTEGVNSETQIQTSAPESTEMPPTPETQEPAMA